MRRLWAALLLTATLALLPAVWDVRAQPPPGELARTATLRLLVADTAAALEQVERIVNLSGGEVLQSERWTEVKYGMSRPYATLVMRLPNFEFENALLRLRSLGMDVLEQNISGKDQTQEYADLQSQIRYLQSQRDRLEGLAAQATTDAERSRVQAELAGIQEQLDQANARFAELYWALHDVRLTLHLVPFIPTPTPTLTPTPRPTTTPWPWDPAQTYFSAREARGMILEFPWVYLCCAGTIVLVVLVILNLASRRRK